MKHLLEQRESLMVFNEIWEFTCLDGWKAFVVDISKGCTGDFEGNRVRGNSCKPLCELRLDSHEHINKVLIVAFEALDSSQDVLVANRQLGGLLD
jgi:hypothetical protein